MRTVLQRRPSAPMVISLVALVVAMSGTAVAAGTLVNGDKLIRKGTLSANRLRKHTLTGRQINLKRLGTVPSAATANSASYATHASSADNATHASSADNATNAGSAANATNATNATNAGNAAALGGRPASGYMTTDARIGTNGVVKLAGSPSGRTATLFTHGPFTVTMTCTTLSNGDTSVSVEAMSTEAGADLNGTVNPPAPANTPEYIGPSTPSSGGPYSEEDYVFALEAPSGAAAVFSGSYGADSLGVSSGCWANFAGIA